MNYEKYWRPSYKYLKVQGPFTNIGVSYPKKLKIWPKFMDYVFIEYAYNSSGDQFLVHKSSIKNMHYNTIME
jgi:hypothetical protein